MSFGHKISFNLGVDPSTIADHKSGQKLVRDDVVFSPPQDKDAALVEAIERLSEQVKPVETA